MSMASSKRPDRSIRSAVRRIAGAIVVACLLFVATGSAQQPNGVSQPSVTPTATQPVPAEKAAEQTGSPDQPTKEEAAVAEDQPAVTEAAEASDSAKDPTTYGIWVLLPALVAIVLAIFTRQVVPALVAGVLVGAFMMVPCLRSDHAFSETNSLLAGIRLAAEHYVLGAIVDTTSGFGHARIMMFTLIIGFAVGVIGRNGGTAGMVKLVAGKTESPRRGALTAWFAGLVVFFDDYANTMIVGPTMAPIFDRLKISRAKLAYIVDSTAAPVASLAIIGTWVGAEISYIDNGLMQLAAAGTPGFLDGVSGMSAFISSLPYRFYPLLALFLVFLVAVTGRDFGPMKKAQDRCVSQPGSLTAIASPASDVDQVASPRWWLGVVPIFTLVAVTLIVMVGSGRAALDPAALSAAELPLWEKASMIIGAADSYVAIFYGAIASSFIAIGLTLAVRACPVKDAVDAGLEGMAKMFPALVVLVLAWAISQVSQDLQLGAIVGGYLEGSGLSVHMIPVAVFVCSALVSFATGSSWATMGILCPITVTITANMAASLPPEQALVVFYQAVGSVLAGSIFGDHCSPISDTTVLSSIASGCPHEEHVWTQLPYAVITALVGIAASVIICDIYAQPWYYGLGAGAIVLFLIVMIAGRPPKPRLDLVEIQAQLAADTES